MHSNIKIQIGLRLLLASLILFIAGASLPGYMMAAIVMSFPGWKYVKGKLAEGLTVEETSDLLTKVKDQTNGQLSEMKKSLEAQGLELQRLKMGGVLGGKSIADILQSKQKDFQALKDGQSRSVKFSIPSQKTLVQTSSVSGSTLGMRLADVGQLPTIAPTIRGLFRSGTVAKGSGGRVVYFDVATATRNAAPRNEGAEKPESAVTFEEREMILRKIADSIPVTKEALEDFDFMAGEIERLLNTNLTLKVDQQLWDGDGNAPNLQGVFDLAGEFSPSSPLIFAPNIFDLIMVMRSTLMNGKGGKYLPDTVVMNPIDLTAFKLSKGNDEHYLLPITASNDIGGMRIIESGQVDAGTLLIGDFRYGTVYSMGDTEIQIGHIDKQFLENSMTILAEERLGLLIREVDEDAFMKCSDISAALLSIAVGS